MNLAQSEEFNLFGTTFRGAEMIRSPMMEQAKRHMRRSLALASVATIVALTVVFFSGTSVRDGLPRLLVSAYAVWASYWGIVGLTDALTDAGDSRGFKV